MLKNTKNAEWQFKFEITRIRDAFKTRVEVIRRKQKVFGLSATWANIKKNGGAKLWVFIALTLTLAIGGCSSLPFELLYFV